MNQRMNRPSPNLTAEENIALIELMAALEAVQDWSGTRVGDAMGRVDDIFFEVFPGFEEET